MCSKQTKEGCGVSERNQRNETEGCGVSESNEGGFWHVRDLVLSKGVRTSGRRSTVLDLVPHEGSKKEASIHGCKGNQ
jgi:hypothetical protein